MLISYDDSFTMKELSVFELTLSSSQQIKLNAVNEDILHKITNRFFVESASAIVFDKAFNIAEKSLRFVVAVDIVKSLNVIVLKNKF